MDLNDSPAEAQFRARLRGWLTQRLPERDDPDRRWEIDELRAWHGQLHRAGYSGLTWPREHGGRGLAPSYQAIFAEESALAGAPDQLNVIGLNMVGPTLIAHGDESQRARYLPGILSGEILFCQGFSEPDAGSDLASIRTRAVPNGDGYALHGEKVWSSYAHLADACLLLARTGPADARHRGLTCFLVDMHSAGVDVRPLRQLSGDRDFSQIILTGAEVTDRDVVGGLGKGWAVAMSTLAHERGTFGVTLTARLTTQFRRLVETVRALDAQHDPLLRQELATIYTRIQGLRHTGYRAVCAGNEPGPESSILKLEWSSIHQRVCALAFQLLRRARGDAEHPWHRYWLHQRLRSRANTIEGGTSEILRGIIAERVLGLPKSH